MITFTSKFSEVLTHAFDCLRKIRRIEIQFCREGIITPEKETVRSAEENNSVKMVDRASNQDDEFYRNLSRRCSGSKDVPIVSLRLELLINEINPTVIPESDTMADGSGLSNETKPEMLPAHAKTSHQDTSTVRANNRWVLDIIQNLKPTILEQSYLERSLLTSDEPSLPHTKQARQQTTYAPELSTPEQSIVSPNNLDQDDCNSSSDEEDLMSFESGSDRTKTILAQIIKKPSLTDRAHVNEMRDLFVEYLQIQASIAAPTRGPDTGMPLNLVIPTVSEEFLAADEERILSKIASPEKSTEADKVATLIQDEADLAVVTFKSFLHSIQEQHDAMYYEEMQLMLKKHSHLAITCYDSAVVLFGEGLASFMLKEYEESFEKFREAELILQDCVHFDKSISNDLSLCLMYMGDVEISQGHYKSAPEYYERAIASHLHHGPPSQLEEIFKLERTTLSAMLSKHALSLCSNDCVVDSEERYKQAVSCPDTTPSDIIMAHTGLGNLLHSLGSNEKAVPEYLAAIDIAEKEKDYLSLAWAHGNLGNTYLSLGKKEKGLSHFQTSLDLTLEHDFDPSSISRALNNLGTAYQSLNELDKAEIYFDQALSQAIYANDVVAQARAYGNIGNVYMLRKDFLKAIPHYTEVLRLSRDRSTVYVAYHNRSCALFELAEKKKGEQYQFTKRGEFQFIAIGPDTGDMDYKHQPDEELDDHTIQLYQQSLKDLRKVIKNVESAFSNSSSSTIGLDLYLSLFHINAKTFQRAQDCAFNLRDHYLSLTIAEQVRARTLGELLLKQKSHQLPTTFRTPLNIDAIKLAVELLPDPYTPVVVLSYTGTRLLVWVLVFDGKTVSVNSFEQEPDEELFGKQLDMYLRYELADDLTGKIDLYGEEEESGGKTKKLVKKEKGAKRSGPARKRKILSDLYKMIAKPLEAILKAVIPKPILHSRGPHKLILIPDNSTKMIRFNALLNEEGGIYFGDKHTLQFFPSLLCLGIMSQAPPTVIHINGSTTGDVLIVGDSSTPAFKFEGEDWTPGPLPHAKKEAEWVGHYMGTPPLLGGEPTKEVVLAKLSQAKLIHLATHGSASYGFVLLAGHCYDRQTTLTSSLRYHEDEKKLLLYASEIESLRLQSCLVILSSCDSGWRKFKGDEIQGMSRSFLLAGAAAVMTSLWKVPDQCASYFMQYFYRYLLDGHTSSGDVLIVGDPSTPAFKFEGEDWTPGPLPHAKTFISLNLKIEELQLMELNKSLDLFPDSFAHHKVLPHLLNVFEFGGAGPTVLAPLLKIGKLLPEDEYQRKIVPCIVRSFGSNDRATRLNLLQHLDQFIDQLQPSVLNNSLFGQIVTGFTDTVPTIREHTIKASLLLAPKLNDSNLSQLLKFFAKCQLDEQAGIRTNTTICLGKIAPHLNSKTRDRVLVSAFTRSLKDPFPPARSAGIGALGSTLSYYTPVDMATRIIPSLSHMTVDKDQSVREQTFKVLRLYVDKLEEHSKKMEPLSDGEGIEQTEGSSSVASWTAGWVSSISKYVSTSSAAKPEATPTAPPTSSYQPSQRQTQEVKTTIPTTSEERRDDKWDEDQWEDFGNDDTKKGTTHSSSGWDDEMWESFEPTPKKTTPTGRAPASSSMKFSKNKSLSPPPDDDFWSRLETSKPSMRGRDKTTPPLVPSSIFNTNKTGQVGGAKSSGGGASSDGWGDWDDSEFEPVQDPVRGVSENEETGSNVMTNEGWEFEGGGWEDATPMSKPATKQEQELERQRELERKREERRARQEAARKKRSAGMSLKPTGLGAVKKD